MFKDSTTLDYLAIDLLGPLIKSENGCTDILVITDYFRNLERVMALQSKKAQVVGNALLENWKRPYGRLEHVLSENGPQFVVKVFRPSGQFSDSNTAGSWPITLRSTAKQSSKNRISYIG